MAYQSGVNHISIIATDVFRNADIGLPIEIIDQDVEGRFGFLSVAHSVEQSGHSTSVESLIVWESGSKLV